MCVLCWAGVAAAGRMSPLGAILLKPRIIDTLGSGEEPAAAAGGLAPPPRRPFRGFSRSVRILGPPMGPRDGRRAGLPGGVALACAHTVQTGQEASPGPPSRVLSIGPSRLLLHLPSHQLSPSAEKSQAPAFHVTSPPSPVLLCPQSHSGGRRLPFPANALAVGCHPRGLCCVWCR